jgi:hypothetical protein
MSEKKQKVHFGGILFFLTKKREENNKPQNCFDIALFRTQSQSVVGLVLPKNVPFFFEDGFSCVFIGKAFFFFFFP